MPSAISRVFVVLALLGALHSLIPLLASAEDLSSGADSPQQQGKNPVQAILGGNADDRWSVFRDVATKLTGAMHKSDPAVASSGKTVGTFVYDAVLTMFTFVVELAVELVRVYSPSLGETLHSGIVKTNLFSNIGKLAQFVSS